MTGAKVAWQLVEGGPWTHTHRVFQGGLTFCSRKIPFGEAANIGHGALSSGTCGRCERMYKQSLKYQAERGEKISA